MINNSLKKLTKYNWSEKKEIAVTFLFSAIITLLVIIGANFASVLLTAFIENAV